MYSQIEKLPAKQSSSDTHLNTVLCNAVVELMERAQNAPAFERKQLLTEAGVIDEIRFRLSQKSHQHKTDVIIPNAFPTNDYAA